MRKAGLKVAMCATMLWAGTVQATLDPQVKCNQARATAWKTYTFGMRGMVAKLYGGWTYGVDTALAKRRHKYFKQWTVFQSRPSLATSTCIGTRFTNNGDGTVTDNLTTLVWEKKQNQDGSPNFADPHDADNTYTWSTGAPYKENGTAFTSVLATLNSGEGFAGANGWRLPTMAELETIVLDFPCTGANCSCPSSFCVDPALEETQVGWDGYWSATSYLPAPVYAWSVTFLNGYFIVFTSFPNGKAHGLYVRAVRGGM